MFARVGRIVAFLAVACGLAAIVGSFVVAPDVLSPGFDRTSLSFRQSTLWRSAGFFRVGLGSALRDESEARKIAPTCGSKTAGMLSDHGRLC